MPVGAPKVAQRIPFRSVQEAESYLRNLGAKYRKIDEWTGRPLYKTGANVVFRPATDGRTLEVLSNCAC